MFLEMKRITTKPGAAKAIAERFKSASLVSQQPGFIRLESGLALKTDKEEICVLIYWESKQAFLDWKKSPAHLEGHKHRQKNEDVLESSSHQFEILA